MDATLPAQLVSSSSSSTHPVPISRRNGNAEDNDDRPGYASDADSSGADSGASDDERNTAVVLPVPDADGSVAPQMSKKARKRMLKQQFKDQKKAEQRELSREKRREKRKTPEAKEARKRAAIARQTQPAQNPPRFHVVIDLNWRDLMTDKEISSVVTQVRECYSSNKKQPTPLNLYVSSADSDYMDRFKKLGANSWQQVRIVPDNFLSLAPDPSKVVYLSSESENTIQTLDPDTYYIIGGLVDHNHHKGVCFNRATQQNLRTARLPLSEHVRLNSRAVLTINHVYSILLSYANTGDWTSAITQALPQRKIADAASSPVTSSSATSSLAASVATAAPSAASSSAASAASSSSSSSSSSADCPTTTAASNLTTCTSQSPISCALPSSSATADDDA